MVVALVGLKVAAACTMCFCQNVMPALMLHSWQVLTSQPKKNATDSITVIHLAMVTKVVLTGDLDRAAAAKSNSLEA